MALAEELPPDASIATTGLTLRYVGEWVYAYSGVITLEGGNETELLGFRSGSGIIVADVIFYYAGDSNYSVLYKGKLNTEVVTQFLLGGNDIAGRQTGAPMPILIPPYTDCSFTADNVSNTSNVSQALTIIGRVYDA